MDPITIRFTVTPPADTSYGKEWSDTRNPRVILATSSPGMQSFFEALVTTGALKKMSVGTLFASESNRGAQVPNFERVGCLVYGVDEVSSCKSDEEIRQAVELCIRLNCRIVFISTNPTFLADPKFAKIGKVARVTFLRDCENENELTGSTLPFSVRAAKSTGEETIAAAIFSAAQQ